MANNADVEKYRYDFEEIRNTTLQIIKDFNLFGKEIIFSGNALTAYEELKQQHIPFLE